MLNEIAKILKNELNYVESLKAQYPSTLEAAQESIEPDYASKANEIRDRASAKREEVEAFLFYHPEFKDEFEVL